MNPKLYTGNGSTNAITGVGFQPDLTWTKRRDNTGNHSLYDSVRGVTKRIESDTSDAENTVATSLTAFDVDGFTLGSGGDSNGNSETYVSWNFKANGAGSANTDGTINSTVSVNTTSGFSIVKYVGNSTAGATVGHGLGVVPQLILFKRLNASNVWITGDMVNSFTKIMFLDTTAASTTDSNAFNDTNPTSSVFTLGSALGTGTNFSGDDYIAYCFANIDGYQRVGEYIGNGNADGTFVYTGFKPALVIAKRTNGTANWVIFDNKRSGFNVDNDEMSVNTSGGDNDGQTYQYVDLLSNGFKWRESSNNKNGNGDTYVFLAIGQTQVGTNDTPATAR